MTAADRRADRMVVQLASRASRAERVLVEACLVVGLVGLLAGLGAGIAVADRVSLRVPCGEEVGR